MTYATPQSLIDRFGQSELDQVADIGAGVADAARVAQALGDADAEIDAALLGRYALPLATVPDLLERIACDLAREFLYKDQPPEAVSEAAKRARALLAQIAAGKMRLDAAPADAGQAVTGLVEIVSGRTRTPFGGKV